VIGLMIGGAVLSLWALFSNRAHRGESVGPLVYHTVARGDLSITVTERGSLESQQETRIVCEVETFSGQSGTRIVWIVPNGKSVKKSDLLVELDSAPLRDRMDNQVVAHEQARAAQIQAASRYENQKSQNETALAAAKLKVELAELGLKMYEDAEDGTYQITRQDLGLKTQEAKNQIVEAQASQLLQKTARSGMEMLYKLGYRGKGDLDQAVLKSLQAEDSLVKATNSLANAVASGKKFEEFEHPMKKLELGGALNTAKQNLLQAQRDNESLLAQALAAKIAADRALAKEEERGKKYEAQLEKCRIHAPHDGMVAYSTERTPWGALIGEGALVIERTKILTLPELTSMQVKTAVHESALDNVHEGLPATVKIDAFPDLTYEGTVSSVGVLPVQSGGYMNPDVKVYETTVLIDEEVEHLKPGMTAVVEIHVDRLKDVLSVPVQTIVQVEGENWCYVASENGPERRTVTLGPTNDKFVQIVDGLEEGARVVLNPMAIVQKGSADEASDSNE
jgi:HlyD family secretion protein